MKRAIILEGGAMRSSHSAGALTALVESGYQPENFDFVIGTSAGACNGSYFLSGQTDLLWQIWSEALIDPRFINLKNLFGKKPVINLDYMIEEIMLDAHPLKINKALTSGPLFYVVATNCRTGKPEYFLNDKEENFFSVIKASSAIPILYHKTVKVNDCEYLDGAIGDPLPIKKAIALGAEEIFVLLTRPEGYRKTRSFADNLVGSLLKKYPNLKDPIINRHITYNDSLEFIEKNRYRFRIHVIRPSYNTGVTRVTSDPRQLKAAFRLGYYDALKVLKRNDLLKAG